MNKKIVKGINFGLALLLFILFTAYIVSKIPAGNFSFSFLSDYRIFIFRGWLSAIWISMLSLVLSLMIGFVIYLMTINTLPYLGHFLRYTGLIFNEIIFGSPLLVFVLIVYYFIGTAFGYEDRLTLGVSALSLYMAPYMTNLFRGAMESVGEEQHTAAQIFGFSPWQKYRYIILPQIAKIMLPPLTGNLTFIVKGSALLHMIGYHELFYAISTAQSRTYAFTEGYIIMMISYLLITIPLIKITTYLERRLNK